MLNSYQQICFLCIHFFLHSPYKVTSMQFYACTWKDIIIITIVIDNKSKFLFINNRVSKKNIKRKELSYIHNNIQIRVPKNQKKSNMWQNFIRNADKTIYFEGMERQSEITWDFGRDFVLNRRFFKFWSASLMIRLGEHHVVFWKCRCTVRWDISVLIYFGTFTSY